MNHPIPSPRASATGIPTPIPTLAANGKVSEDVAVVRGVLEKYDEGLGDVLDGSTALVDIVKPVIVDVANPADSIADAVEAEDGIACSETSSLVMYMYSLLSSAEPPLPSWKMLR